MAEVPADLTFKFTHGPGTDPFVTMDWTAFIAVPFAIDDVTFDIDTLTIVPTPGAIALFALAIPLVFFRRHR